MTNVCKQWQQCCWFKYIQRVRFRGLLHKPCKLFISGNQGADLQRFLRFS